MPLPGGMLCGAASAGGGTECAKPRLRRSLAVLIGTAHKKPAALGSILSY